MELWKDIPGYEGLYQASNTGLIRSKPGKTTSNKRFEKRVWKSRILKPKFKKSKYRNDAAVSLWKDGRSLDFLVSRLVAMTWVEGFSPEMTVNHIDGNPQNNNCSNLEWITLAENIKKGFETGLYKNTHLPVRLIHNGEIFAFPSMSKASSFLGRNTGYVSECLKHDRCPMDKSGKQYAVLKGEQT